LQETEFTPSEDATDCPLCGLNKFSALAAGLRPAEIVHPGWVRCDCQGEQPFNVGEAILRRSERSEDSWLLSEIRRCWYEDVNRPHEPGGSSSGSSRSKVVPRSGVRSEQEWHGFSESDYAETERLEDLVVPVSVNIPKWIRKRWKTEAATTESRYLRWLSAKYLGQVESVTKIPRGFKRERYKFLMTPQNKTLWDAKKAQLGCSHSELLVAILIKEWT
jgi:hypothetical protein